MTRDRPGLPAGLDFIARRHVASLPKRRLHRRSLCGSAALGGERDDRHCSAASAAAARRGRGGSVRFCADCASARASRDSTGGDDADARQAAFRRAEPAGGGDHPRGARAPPHLAPAAGRAGQAQHLDAGEGARRPPAVHARDHRAAGAGARRLAAQGQRRGAGRACPPTATSRPTASAPIRAAR